MIVFGLDLDEDACDTKGGSMRPLQICAGCTHNRADIQGCFEEVVIPRHHEILPSNLPLSTA